MLRPPRPFRQVAHDFALPLHTLDSMVMSRNTEHEVCSSRRQPRQKVSSRTIGVDSFDPPIISADINWRELWHNMWKGKSKQQGHRLPIRSIMPLSYSCTRHSGDCRNGWLTEHLHNLNPVYSRARTTLVPCVLSNFSNLFLYPCLFPSLSALLSV